ncbi:polysaccharide pyruvyl transferase family protein [Tomitella gaofuii]|uniref:polysaccharide pyruvyl transferase family protein n=1 Tax=Tomitella gaofuii TaxID=2760083 RepID=UPI0015F909EF|nr:polysaccharide pyruvyl transferase family protein [Tomitella gaofuii]
MRTRWRARAARMLGGGPSGRVHYLVSPAGHPNYGDELIARTWLEHLARVRPDDEVVLDCHTPGQAALLLRGSHPRVTYVDTLWRMIGLAAENARPGPVWEWCAHAAVTLGAEPRIDEGVALLQRADTLHLLGGGYLNAVWPHHTALVTAMAALARRFGIRATATGQGLMPTAETAPREALVNAARAFAVFDTRDRASFEALVGVPGASRTGDDAWLGVDGAVGAAPREPVPDAGVVLCLQSDLTEHFAGDGRTGADAVAHWARRVLDSWEVPGAEVTVVEGIPGKDRLVYERLGERLDGAQFVPFRDLWHHGVPARAGQTWLSTRFHLHLVAASAGAAGVAVATEPGYYEVKHRSLLDVGSRWTLVTDGDTLPARPTAGGFTPERRRAAMAAKTALADRLYPPR